VNGNGMGGNGAIVNKSINAASFMDIILQSDSLIGTYTGDITLGGTITNNTYSLYKKSLGTAILTVTLFDNQTFSYSSVLQLIVRIGKTFFINEPFTISQSTSLYADTMGPDLSTYDYILDVNTTAGSWITLNQLFNMRDFIQNTNINTYDVDLTVNVDSVSNLLFSNSVVNMSSTMQSVSTNSAYSSLNQEPELIGLRFLEIVATKIFGHSKARAAIGNDTDFYVPYSITLPDESIVPSGSLIQQITDGINNALYNKKTDIFNMYVGYDRIELNPVDDISGNATFNFDNTTWEFPIYLHSSLTDIGIDSLDLVNNGPDVGGNILRDGSMNVPILLRFS
jgi:hypothetical protein